MTKNFDSICKKILGETLMAPTAPAQGQPAVQPTQSPQPQSAVQNNMDYKKVWDMVSKLAPDHLQQLTSDLANHLKTAAAQQPAQQPNAVNQSAQKA